LKEERRRCLCVVDRRGDDDEDEVAEAGVVDRVLDPRRNVDHVVPAHDLTLAVDLHQAFALEHVVDLLLHLVAMRRHIGLGLIAGDAVVDEPRAHRVRMNEELGEGAAVMAGQLLPRDLRDVPDRRGASALLRHARLLAFSRLSLGLSPAPGSAHHGRASAHWPGTCFSPNTGSLCGMGGSAQVPVAGGRTLASTCTSIRQGASSLIACSSAPLKSCDLVTLTPSTPHARAQAAKSGL